MPDNDVPDEFMERAEPAFATDRALRETKGLAIKLSMLMTHYRKPMDWTQVRFEQAQKTLLKWWSSMEPNESAPPADFMAAMLDDMNTPLAIACMHKYHKNRDGKKLYAAMSMLGLIPREDLDGTATQK